MERDGGNCFMVECPNDRRDHHTLIPLIKQFVLPGTTIITDGWAAYLPLPHHGYTHLDVNHSVEFVNHATGAHTNTVEGSWYHAKRHCRRGLGWIRRDSEALTLALSEFMWLKRYGITRSQNCRLFFKEIPLLMSRMFD